MYRMVACDGCNHQFAQLLPDVTVAEGERLKAADEDRRVVFECPKCRREIYLPRWAVPELPLSP
jgi:hypothetical protein